MLLFSDWPPALSNTQLEALTHYATTYALSHGLLYLPRTHPQPPVPSSAIHAPLSLLPSLFPQKLFHLAQQLQRTYNVLYARIALDEEFLDDVMGTAHGVGKVDDFIGQLWSGWKDLRDQGMAQPLQLGLFRSDYLLHTPTPGTVTLKQVEFNTISASFGALSERAAELHRYLFASTNYFNSSPFLRADNLPVNNSIAGLTEGLAAAHKAYRVEGARILFVVQPGERNVFDQQWLEYELLQKYSIHVIRQTFHELSHSASVEPQTSTLCISCSSELIPSGFVEISTVYYRAGYTPADYPTPAHYQTRLLLERSSAIKCPSIALQLAGGKKVQEVLTHPGVLERFLCDGKKWGKDDFDERQVRELRDTFMGMWGLDAGEDLLTPDLDAIQSGTEGFGIKHARELACSLVLKPQREGGGNNVYKDDIVSFLTNLSPEERQAWIAMELIVPPKGAKNYLIRTGGIGPPGEVAVKADVVSELGIFGWALFGDSSGEVMEKEAGWLLRTKGDDSNEGGIATGFSVLDSLLLVDG